MKFVLSSTNIPFWNGMTRYFRGYEKFTGILVPRETSKLSEAFVFESQEHIEHEAEKCAELRLFDVIPTDPKVLFKAKLKG